MKPIQGLHHITAVAKDPQANVDFYEKVLGQRLVKKTVNFDDPGTYHLYYGDEVGTPGTIMTFFPWPNMHKGRVGNGETSAVAYSIPKDSISYWRDRLTTMGIPIEKEVTRFGEEVLVFNDAEGIQIELVATDDPSTIQVWAEGPIPEKHALRGFHSVTLLLDAAGASAELLIDQMGYSFVGNEGNRYRYEAASNDRGLYIDIEEHPGGERGAFGAGSIHHIAFRTVDDEEQLEYRNVFIQGGRQVTPVRDRQYFHSIYFREPGGVLFEVATDAPGFLYDEPIDELGDNLKLPSWLEGQRDILEHKLPTIQRAQIDKEV